MKFSLKQAQDRGLIVGESKCAAVNDDGISLLSEAAFQEQVIALARSLHYRVAHFRKVRVQRKNGSTHWETPVAADGKGFPDLLIVGRGRVFAMELKKHPNVPSIEQLQWIEAMSAAGIDADVYYTDEMERIVEKLT